MRVLRDYERASDSNGNASRVETVKLLDDDYVKLERIVIFFLAMVVFVAQLC